ncbi:MAG: Ig-like domain-containing protein [Monoglobaceae bacterium]
MRKLIGLAAAAAMILSLIPFGAFAADENGVGTVYYSNDFSTSDKIAEMNSTATDMGDGTMKMAGTSAYWLKFGNSSLPQINTAAASIEIKIKFPEAPVTPNGWMGYMLGLDDNDASTNAISARVKFGYDAYTKVYKVTGLRDGSASEWKDDVVAANSISPDEWHKLCMVTDAGNYDLYIDGNKITTGPLGMNTAALAELTAINYMNNGSYCATLLDDFLVKETGTMALRNSSVTDGATDVSVNTERIELTFENPIAGTSKENITLSGLTKDTDYTVEIDRVNDARKAVISFTNQLASNTTYTINYDVTDYMGGTANGAVGFTTEAQATPPEPVETTVSVKPESGAANVNAYSPIVFTYNKNIDAETVPAELTLSNGRKANVTVSGKVITVLPVNPKATSEAITVTLPDTIQDEEGAVIPTSTTSYTTMEDSVYFAHIFRDRDNAEQTTSEFPQTPYLVESPQSAGDGFVKGNGLVENDGTLTLIYMLDQGIDSAETMEYYATVSQGSRGSASYYMGTQRDGLISEANKIVPSEVINDTRDNGTGSQNQYTKNIFAGDGTKKYFAVVVNGKNYVPQLQYVKFNQPKPEAVTSDIPTADGNSVTFTMNSRLDAESVSADKFNVNGESVLSATVSGNKLTLVFSALDFQKTYTVTAEGVTNVYGTELSELKFITTKAIEVLSCGIEETSLIAGGTATGKIKVKNNSPEEQEVMAAAAYYNSDQMLQAKVKRIQIGAGATEDITLDKIDITAAGENYSVKLFAWLAETYQPVSGVFEISGTSQD